MHPLFFRRSLGGKRRQGAVFVADRARPLGGAFEGQEALAGAVVVPGLEHERRPFVAARKGEHRPRRRAAA